MPINNLKKFIPINISILTISDTRTEATDTSGQILAKKVREKGHALLHKEIVKDEKELIKKILLEWSSDKEVDVILTTGGTGLTGRDTTPEALDEIKDKDIPGFGELFRLISYKK
ncbi:MAG: molybdopterin-binding protein, partial [Proteobacteria bacterium]|nr:molybdopterin-binding protein [Pseudomonadota bacterium]